jgi:hypothetical protein
VYLGSTAREKFQEARMVDKIPKKVTAFRKLLASMAFLTTETSKSCKCTFQSTGQQEVNKENGDCLK